MTNNKRAIQATLNYVLRTQVEWYNKYYSWDNYAQIKGIEKCFKEFLNYHFDIKRNVFDLRIEQVFILNENNSVQYQVII